MMTELNELLAKLKLPACEPQPEKSADPLQRIKELARSWGVPVDAGADQGESENE